MNAIRALWQRLAATPRHYWPIYAVLYLGAGFAAQGTHEHTQVARFAYDFQVLTLYGLFLIPLSAIVRGLPWHQQYAYAVAAIGPIDVCGFAIGSSLAYPDNFIERAFGVRSFTLAFVLIAGLIPIIGNTAVTAIARLYEARRTRAGLAGTVVAASTPTPAFSELEPRP